MKLDFVFSFFSPLFDHFAVMGLVSCPKSDVLFLEASLTNLRRNRINILAFMPFVKHEADFTLIGDTRDHVDFDPFCLSAGAQASDLWERSRAQLGLLL